ncbi:hypothetical protein [Bradyrhizobium sp. Arg816]|uniref:hypothetical protein n=1 Tax=Bradyrhizobium sp. Arg816 TaxID=2998491 RepID=UPI00249DB4C0|nr:hypothetical protein [Bradyrhizobium sp. Arg816]MDI3561293.1 hypothetical protein [Bradyrhizobium sp. Arg816]
MTNEATIATPVPKSRGWRRYQELRRQDAADKIEIMRGLLDGLGRPSTMADRIAAEQIASLVIWARVLERRGALKAAAEVRDQITRTQRANNFKPQPAVPQKPSGDDFLEEMQTCATPQEAE